MNIQRKERELESEIYNFQLNVFILHFQKILKHFDFTQEKIWPVMQSYLSIENTLNCNKDISARFPPQATHPWAFIIKLTIALTLNRWTQFYNVNTNSMHPLLLEFQM